MAGTQKFAAALMLVSCLAFCRACATTCLLHFIDVGLVPLVPLVPRHASYISLMLVLCLAFCQALATLCLLHFRRAFTTLCLSRSVLCRALDSHLFSDSELTTMDEAVSLPSASKNLLLHLALRKGPWFALKV